MTEPERNDSAESPGRMRTWWHPVLVSILKWALQDSYEVRDEVSVGRMPLRIDVVLLRRLAEPPEIAWRELGPLLRLLNEYTAVEFKSPSDTLETGDLDQLLGCVHLFRSQQRPPLERGTISAAIIAPAISNALREDAERLDLTLHERETGVWEIAGGLFPLWIIETDRLAQDAETVLAFFSRIFLRDAKPIIDHWRETGHAGILHFIVQQIEQFKREGETFIMQHKDAELMEQTWEELQAAVLASAPPKKRLEGISPEERLEGLSEAELKRLQQLLEKRLSQNEPQNGDDAV